MSDRDQQDECPKAFYCLPESCGDCPDQQLPCEGCPDPGMPCLGCPAVGEQETPLPETTGEFISKLARAYAEGERAATERICKIMEARPLAFIDYSTMRDLLAVIERGEHE